MKSEVILFMSTTQKTNCGHHAFLLCPKDVEITYPRGRLC